MLIAVTQAALVNRAFLGGPTDARLDRVVPEEFFAKPERSIAAPA
jgi:hypothetical protein